MKNQEKKLLWAMLIACGVFLSAGLLEASVVAAASLPAAAHTNPGASSWVGGGANSYAFGDAASLHDGSHASTSPAAQDADGSAKPQSAPAKDSGMVWVNMETGVYHKPGSRWYGKTKKGKYMLESDAIKAGYKPAKPAK
jgi:hypothetical protein